jgi:serine/threonine-protein kinase
MGVVYRAHQASLERSVAVKLMMGVDEGGDGGDAALADRASEFQRRFFLEAATAAKLKHPNTITVFDYGSTSVDGERVFYITMELLDGITLSKLMSHEGPIAPARAVNIAMQMCRSLREAHSHGIVHRDLKPGNVMLVKQDAADADHDGAGDFVKVLDFGLAKTRLGDKRVGPQLTKAGTFLGSPRYVAPEQIEGKPVDGRADIYSFGCVLYRMLTGRVPFDGQQAVEVMLKHLSEAVPPMSTPELTVPKTLEDLVMRCLEKKAADRPASMDEVIAVLKRARIELTGMASGNIVISEANRASSGIGDAGANSLPPVPLTTLATPKEATSPSQTAPPSTKKPQLTSSSQPSLNTPGPLSISGEWKIGPSSQPSNTEESTRPTHAPHRVTVIQGRRTPGVAIAFGVVVGVLLAGVAIAGRLGMLDPLIGAVVLVVEPAPEVTRPAGPVAVAAVQSRLRIRTDPEGADVFDVTSGVPKLLGITPLVVAWDVAVGDPSKELVLKLPGFVSARARVEPPQPSSSGEPVTLDVGATLRPSPR